MDRRFPDACLSQSERSISRILPLTTGQVEIMAYGQLMKEGFFHFPSNSWNGIEHLHHNTPPAMLSMYCEWKASIWLLILSKIKCWSQRLAIVTKSIENAPCVRLCASLRWSQRHGADGAMWGVSVEQSELIKMWQWWRNGRECFRAMNTASASE